MKFKENKLENIVKNIFFSGLIYISSSVLLLIPQYLNSTSVIAYYLSRSFLFICILIKITSSIFLLKFICDATYKLLKNIEK